MGEINLEEHHFSPHARTKLKFPKYNFKILLT